jgi:hypothetical protein
MRLHDIQVILASADNASKFQGVTQFQGQAAQAQNALQLTAQENAKHSRIQQTENKSETKAVAESEQRFRQWKKDRSQEKKQAAIRSRSNQEKDDALPPFDRDHIIDIKV